MTSRSGANSETSAHGCPGAVSYSLSSTTSPSVTTAPSIASVQPKDCCRGDRCREHVAAVLGEVHAIGGDDARFVAMHEPVGDHAVGALAERFAQDGIGGLDLRLAVANPDVDPDHRRIR